ncbi:GntR family transcriptional regulator [uncultured Actinomyces sp.]|uniref:GntR family transcriptional regulator n=1 Tax=uncultured Actinomyces sp. TaxID=249061 RepID=UPI0026109234|nr:GntR family transcriptional regulator [uncultured Actinomyces sp.]
MAHAPFSPNIRVVHDSDVPLHAQISDGLAAMILSGEIAPGTRLENEVSMAKRLDVSRPTARQALQSLADRGLVKRRRGAGTVVTAPHVRRPMQLSSLLTDLEQAGFEVETRVMSYNTHRATEDEAQRLETESGAPVTFIQRLRLADGDPIALMSNLIPSDIAPTREELEESGLYDQLRAKGVVPSYATQVIGARNATLMEADALGEKRGAALLTATRIAYDAQGTVIDYGTHIYRASRYSFETKFFAD